MFPLKINRRYSLKPCNCSGCSSDNLSCHDVSVQQSCPPLALVPAPTFTWLYHKLISLKDISACLKTSCHRQKKWQRAARQWQIKLFGEIVTVSCPCRSQGTLPPTISFPRGLRWGAGCASAALLGAAQSVDPGCGATSRAVGQSSRGVGRP